MDNVTINGDMNSNNIEINNAASVKNALRIDIKGKNNTLIIDASAVIINLRVFFVGSNSTVHLSAHSKVGGLIMLESNCSVSVGNGSRINHNATRIHCGEDNTNIKIGDNCLLANVRFRTSDEHSIIDLDSKARINKAKDITVMDGVWLAEDVYVYKGVTIGSGSVIAARSTVTRSLPPNSLCAGTPQMLLREI